MKLNLNKIPDRVLDLIFLIAALSGQILVCNYLAHMFSTVCNS